MPSEKISASPQPSSSIESSSIEGGVESWELYAESKVRDILLELHEVLEQGSESHSSVAFVMAERVSSHGKREVFAEGTFLAEKLMNDLERGLAMPRERRPLFCVATREGQPFYPFANHAVLPYSIRIESHE